MNTTIKEEEGKVIASFSGRLDTLAAVQTAKDVQCVIDSDCTDVVLDCEELEYISSSGLRIFISILKSVKARKGTVVVKNINDEIKKVFEMTGFNKLFIITDTRAEACGMLKSFSFISKLKLNLIECFP